MRNRSNSGVRLDYYQRLVHRTILKHQNPATGLFPATADNSHAWVRDNLYSVQAVWGLALAYRKNADLDEDKAKAYELEQSVVKNMRGLLFAMMMQTDKLEDFKKTQNPLSCFHAKYSSTTGKTVVGDSEWGHLQIDATSMFVLCLAQMTASGLQIIYTLDEVSFIQNLVFYIEKAYRTPDYGIWERGDKTNHGLPELNSSSIGMAKAALEAINELDLYGARGGPSSVIHVLPDEAHQCQAILQSMLPRESSSKETDASLLGIISFPAFAVDDPEIIDLTRKTIQNKLQGSYGCCRFLRDGYKTILEDPSRLYYESGELAVFENIECEWPLFFAYFALDGLFRGDREQTQEYMEALEELMVKTEDGLPLVPELYRVPRQKVDLEKKKPGSQKREAIGQLPHKWSQSLYILCKLLQESFLSPGEIDPLNRRLNSEPRPDVVVQVVILAETTQIQNILLDHDVAVETIQEVTPIQVYPAKALRQLYSYLGKNKKLGLTGRPSDEVGLLATSKLYMIEDQLFAFMPQYMDKSQFFLPLDTDFIIDTFKTNVDFLSSNWTMLGRPTMIFPALLSMLDQKDNLHPALIATIKKLQTGYISGTRIQLGNLSDFKTTSCITNLDFIREHEDYEGVGAHQVINLIDGTLSPTCPRPRLQTHTTKSQRHRRVSARSASVSGLVKRTRSIQIDPHEAAEIRAVIQSRLERSAPGNTRYLAFQQSGSVSSRSSQSSSQQSISEETTSSVDRTVSSRAESQPVTPTPSASSSEHHLKAGQAPRFPVSALNSPSSSPKLLHKQPTKSEELDQAECNELVDSLERTESLHEQADILHFLFMNKGLDWDTEMGGKKGCTIRDLLVELYEKAGHWKQWWLVRHTAGMLRKRVEDLALSAADLLVRQKQLSVGLPPEPREKIITSPLPPDELASIIFDAYGEDVSTATLTQEILIYLAMFIRTEPKLFLEMLRLRVGLIIQVMASELARTLKCTGEEASDHLLNLSPFEMKTLLHHILSGKEFRLLNVRVGRENENEDEYRLSVRACEQLRDEENFAKRLSRSYKVIHTDSAAMDISQPVTEESSEEETEDKQGQWLRRRRLDGSLNRTPVGFYKGVWKVLQRCPEIYVEGHSLNQSLTKEMTPEELKFALQVEMVLNRIPQPEFRQLNVEALMIIVLMVENDNNKLKFQQCIEVDKLVREANALFIQDQNMPADVAKSCEGAAGICVHFYDSAPSGRFGTLSYMCRALTKGLNLPITQDENVECVLS